jgi:hypothetical protein
VLTVNTDSDGTSAVETDLTGTGLARSNKPVKLHITHSRVRYSGGRAKVTYRVNFKVPSGVLADMACEGRLAVSMRLAGRKYARKVDVNNAKQRLGEQPRCFSRFTMKFPRSAVGQRGKMKVRFPGNDVMVVSKKTFTLNVS